MEVARWLFTRASEIRVQREDIETPPHLAPLAHAPNPRINQHAIAGTSVAHHRGNEIVQENFLSVTRAVRRFHRLVIGPENRREGRSEEHTSELQSPKDLVC